MKLFTPDYYVESYRALDVERLKQHGIRLLVCDIDNTLAAHDEPLPDDAAKAFVETGQGRRHSGRLHLQQQTGAGWSALPAVLTRNVILSRASR